MTTKGRPEDYDLVILGSGAGSKLLAWTFAERGQRVAAIERKYVGGACPNIACLPSKNIIHTAQSPITYVTVKSLASLPKDSR
jgi:pyruvate/2-oxoglutarate dehydrogenase complex dihydrolipoamide dehydrogenase (E3) component